MSGDNRELDQKINEAADEIAEKTTPLVMPSSAVAAAKVFVAEILRKHFAPLLPDEPQTIEDALAYCEIHGPFYSGFARCPMCSAIDAAEQSEPAKDDERKRS